MVQVFTDGESVLLLTEDDTEGTHALVALDAASGSVVWDRAGSGAGVGGELVAVDGHLLEVTPGGVRGLG